MYIKHGGRYNTLFKPIFSHDSFIGKRDICKVFVAIYLLGCVFLEVNTLLLGSL